MGTTAWFLTLCLFSADPTIVECQRRPDILWVQFETEGDCIQTSKHEMVKASYYNIFPGEDAALYCVKEIID